MLRPTYAEIDLGAIRRNVQAVRARVGSRVKIMPAVKANGYGHGAVQVSLAALEAGADSLGVASIEEALELRSAGIGVPMLILGCAPVEAAGDIVRHGVTSTVCDMEFGRALSDAAVRQGSVGPVHVKVDTGMGRIGVTPNECENLVRELLSLPGIRVEGIFTHLPSSDEPDPTFTTEQLRSFRKLTLDLRAKGYHIPCCHAANSGAILAHKESFLDLVRPGIMIYGLHPCHNIERSIGIEPALSLKSHIVFLKEVPVGATVSYGRTFTAARRTKVATIPIGYADGYNRLLSNRGQAMVRRKLAPVIGRVCMDQTMLDVTDVPEVRVGDEITLYGGSGPISVEEIARKLDTIPYEVVCSISQRVQRLYKG